MRIPGWLESRVVSPSALSSGMLIVVEEMVLLAARPVVLATIRDAAPCLTSAAAPAPSRRCLCEPVEVSYLENSVSIDTFSCSLLLRPLPKAACAVAGRLRSGPVDHPRGASFWPAAGPPFGGSPRISGQFGRRPVLLGVCEDTYLKKEKRVVQWSSGPATSEDGAATVRNRTYRRFRVGGLWTTPPGPRWSSLVQGGPAWSTPRSEQRGGAWLGRAAGLNRSSRERCAPAFRVDRAGSQAQRGSAAR